MWHSTTPSSFPPHTCKRAFRAVLPERHQHLSCVVCPGSFAHVAFGLGLFALVAFVRAEKAESRGRPVLGPVECLRGHRPAKFNCARALTHHPRRRGLGMRGGFFVLLVVVTFDKAVCGGGRGTVKDMCYEVRRAEDARGMCGPVRPSRTSEREGKGYCVKGGWREGEERVKERVRRSVNPIPNPVPKRESPAREPSWSAFWLQKPSILRV